MERGHHSAGGAVGSACREASVPRGRTGSEPDSVWPWWELAGRKMEQGRLQCLNTD